MRRISSASPATSKYDLRNEFFAQLQRLSPAYFHANRTGDLMSRATNDLNAVRMMIGPAVMYTTNTVIVFVGGDGAHAGHRRAPHARRARSRCRLSRSRSSTSARPSTGGSRPSRRQLSELSAVVQEALVGVRIVRAYRQEPPRWSDSVTRTRNTCAATSALIRLQGLFYPSIGLLARPGQPAGALAGQPRGDRAVA